MKRIIAITGADGTGKSTVCRSLNAMYDNSRIVSIWDAMAGSLFHTKKDIDHYLCSLSPNARLFFLSHALIQSLDMALNSGDDLLILNGYFYKYFASELALGADLDVVNRMIEVFPVPGLVIELVGAPGVMFSRKHQLSMYECGLQTPSSEAFQNFQKKALVQWQIFDRREWKTISSELPADEVFSNCLKIIEAWQK